MIVYIGEFVYNFAGETRGNRKCPLYGFPNGEYQLKKGGAVGMEPADANKDDLPFITCIEGIRSS